MQNRTRLFARYFAKFFTQRISPIQTIYPAGKDRKNDRRNTARGLRFRQTVRVVGKTDEPIQVVYSERENGKQQCKRYAPFFNHSENTPLK